MSVALTDLLIDVSDPVQFLEFSRDPESVLARYPELTERDVMALRSRSAPFLRAQAVVDNDDAKPSGFFRQYTSHRVTSYNAAVIEASVDLHIDLTTNGLTAIENDQLFIDGDGVYFRVDSSVGARGPECQVR